MLKSHSFYFFPKMKNFSFIAILNVLFLFFMQGGVASQTSEQSPKNSNNNIIVDSNATKEATNVTSNKEQGGSSPQTSPVDSPQAGDQKNGIITNGSAATPTTSAEPSATVAPTDPSMIPPSNEQSVPDDPSATSSPASQEEETSIPVNSTESIEKKKEQIKVRYYQIRTQVEKNEAVIALRSKADAATNSEEKRQLMRAYYELLFEKMRKVDPSIADRCDVMEAAYLRRLEQVCIEPSVPLNPVPTSDALNDKTSATSGLKGEKQE